MSSTIFIKFPLFTSLFLFFHPLSILSGKHCNDEFCKEYNRDISCTKQPENPARQCVDFEKTIKTDRDKQSILNKINSRRSKVAMGDIRSLSPAANMIKLEWSEALELDAQRWADQCVGPAVPDVVDECLNVEAEGQNIATIYGDAPGLSPLVLVDIWYMELLNINASLMSKYIPSSETGLSHYDYFTQLVWAESNYVGCASVKFKEPKREDRGTTRTVNRLVCNFSPGGNREQMPVYVKGEPCSACPESSSCDVEYNGLCKIIQTEYSTTTEDIPNMTEYNTNTKESNDSTSINGFDSDATANDTNDDDNFMQYNYFTNAVESKEPVTKSQIIGKQCKDMGVDDFLELLKNKLSSDPMFKDLTSKSYTQSDVTNTDPNVAAFIKKVYSKKVPSTTTKVTENEYINSTLLVDLVEAVIFRSGEKMSTPVETESYLYTPIVEVNPIKIKAELSEIKLNQDFTGHYFFPEDDDDNEAKNEMTETADLYDDITRFSISDVALEIEEFKRIKTTRDFLEEILESESATENHVIRHKRLDTISKDNIQFLEDTNNIVDNTRRCGTGPCRPLKLNIKYSDLLQQLALDLKMLKLSDRFHCTKNVSPKNSNINTLFYGIFYIVIIHIVK